MEDLLPFLGPILEILAGKYGFAAQIVSWMVAANGIRLALETFLKAVVGLTSGTGDDALLDKVLSSKVYGLISKVLGLLVNVRLPEKK